MNNYQDHYSRFHDKPVTDKNPIPSGNGWIYTAYAEKVNIPLDLFTLGICFKACKVPTLYGETLLRSPGRENPPISRDEILGLAALGFLKPHHLNKWSFSPYPIPKFNLIKLIKQLLEISPRLVRKIPSVDVSVGKFTLTKLPLGFYIFNKHRNYFWKNNLDQLYRFAFSVPLQDRHSILKSWGKFQFFNPIHLFYAAYGKISSKISPGAMDWLKYDEKKGLAGIKKEFPEDHPIRKKLGL
jgi:hypothetical protein